MFLGFYFRRRISIFDFVVQSLRLRSFEHTRVYRCTRVSNTLKSIGKTNCVKAYVCADLVAALLGVYVEVLFFIDTNRFSSGAKKIRS